VFGCGMAQATPRSESPNQLDKPSTAIDFKMDSVLAATLAAGVRPTCSECCHVLFP
jgi:hypothetical protein